MNWNYFIIYDNFKNKKPKLIRRTWTLLLHLLDASFTCQTFSPLELQAAISMAIFSCSSCCCCCAEQNKVDVQQLFVACTIFYFFGCARASLASWFVAAAPLRFAMPNMQRHYLSINTRPKCSNCNCNCNHSNNNNNNSKSNSTLWHETHSTPGLVVCARFVGPQLWKFFKWCQITRCGHFLILILLPLLVLWSCPSWFFHMESQLETRFWRFLFAVFGSMANVCLGSFFCQPASISLPSSSYTYPLSIWSKEKHKRRI